MLGLDLTPFLPIFSVEGFGVFRFLGVRVLGFGVYGFGVFRVQGLRDRALI